MVRVMRGGEEVKISKRAGSYVTLRDLIEWTSKDAVRFFLLSRKPDTEYTFDIDLALAQNNDNPVYYVQYAHARICSVLAAWGGDAAALKDADLSALESPQAQALMLQLAKYPEMLTRRGAGFRAARRHLLPARTGRHLPQLLRCRAHPGGRRDGCEMRGWRWSRRPPRCCTMDWRCSASVPRARCESAGIQRSEKQTSVVPSSWASSSEWCWVWPRPWQSPST